MANVCVGNEYAVWQKVVSALCQVLEIMQLLFNICKDYGTSIIMATHDFIVISKYPTRMLKTERGKVFDSTVAEV